MNNETLGNKKDIPSMESFVDDSFEKYQAEAAGYGIVFNPEQIKNYKAKAREDYQEKYGSRESRNVDSIREAPKPVYDGNTRDKIDGYIGVDIPDRNLIEKDTRGKAIISQIEAETNKLKGIKEMIRSLDEEENRKELLEKSANSLNREIDELKIALSYKQVDPLRFENLTKEFREKGGAYGKFMEQVSNILNGMSTAAMEGKMRRLGIKPSSQEMYLPFVDDTEKQMRISFEHSFSGIVTQETMIEGPNNIVINIPIGLHGEKIGLITSKDKKALSLRNQKGETVLTVDANSPIEQQVKILEELRDGIRIVNQKNPSEKIEREAAELENEMQKSFETIDMCRQSIDQGKTEDGTFTSSIAYTQYRMGMGKIAEKYKNAA